jgi:hypothetical protein
MGDTALERTIRRLLVKVATGRPADGRMVEQMLEPAGPLGANPLALLRTVPSHS